MSQRGGNRSNQSRGNNKKRGNTNKQPKEFEQKNKNESKGQQTRGGAPKTRGGGAKQRGNKNQHNNKQYTKKPAHDPIEKATELKTNPISGKTEKVQLLSKNYAITDEFISYLPIDNNLNKEETIATLQALNADCNSLLKCKYNEFWSTVTYNPSFVSFIESFLQYWQSHNKLSNPNIKDDELYIKENNVSNLRLEIQLRRTYFLNMWKIIYRLTHINESATEYMTYYHYAKLISSKHLLSVSSLIDICRIFSCYQRKTVSKILQFLFEHQSNLSSDISIIFSQIESTLTQYIKNLNLISPNDRKDIDKSLHETIYFAHSISTSLFMFLELVPDEICLQVIQFHSFRKQIVFFYEVIVPKLQSLIVDKSDNDSVLVMIQEIKCAFYSLFSHLLNVCFITPLTKVQKVEDYDITENCLDFISIIDLLPTLSSSYPDLGSLPPPENKDKILAKLVDDLSLIRILEALPEYFNFV